MFAAMLFSLLVPPGLDAPFREITFEQALAAAKAENKVVMVDFYTDWCQPCKLMDINTWKDKSVHEWLEKHTVPIKVDADEEKATAARYNVKGYPSMLFVKADGEELDRTVGFRTVEQFLTEGREILAGNGVLQRVRAKMKGREQDPAMRQELARALMARARYDEALTEFLWSFDNGAATPSFAATRLRQLLPEIGQFGTQYPPAVAALEERRGKAEAALLAGGDATVAREMAALNHQLQMSVRTLDTYRELETSQKLKPDVKDALFDEVVDQWLDAQNHAELERAIPDVDAWARYEFEPLKAIEKKIDPATGAPPADLSIELSAARQTRTRRATRLYNAFLVMQQPARAAAVADELLEAIPSGASYSALIEAALASENPEAARAFVKRAETALTANEMRRVKIAAKKIPPE